MDMQTESRNKLILSILVMMTIVGWVFFINDVINSVWSVKNLQTSNISEIFNRQVSAKTVLFLALSVVLIQILLLMFSKENKNMPWILSLAIMVISWQVITLFVIPEIWVNVNESLLFYVFPLLVFLVSLALIRRLNILSNSSRKLLFAVVVCLWTTVAIRTILDYR